MKSAKKYLFSNFILKISRKGLSVYSLQNSGVAQQGDRKEKVLLHTVSKLICLKIDLRSLRLGKLDFRGSVNLRFLKVLSWNHIIYGVYSIYTP